MDEQEIPAEEARPGKNKLILLGALVVGVIVLAGGGWVVYQKFMGTKSAIEAEITPKEAEKPVRFSGPLVGVPSGIEGEEPPAATLARDGVSVDQLSVVVMESGERNIQARLFNQGRHPLSAARVDMEFLNSKGDVVLVRPVNPLVVTGGLFGDQSEPLATGSARRFMVATDDTPASWSGKLAARIRDLQFGQPWSGEARR
ncbi:MAG: hypothetical protein HQL92_04420 [Magnetococcales bacterium]|nr:hypothetical protein [Magnetococcales bacterium]